MVYTSIISVDLQLWHSVLSAFIPEFDLTLTPKDCEEIVIPVISEPALDFRESGRRDEDETILRRRSFRTVSFGTDRKNDAFRLLVEQNVWNEKK
jgi:hypothetical protein